MNIGDLVKVHLLNDLEWHEALGIFTGYESKYHSNVFVEGKRLMFLTMDVKAVK